MKIQTAKGPKELNSELIVSKQVVGSRLFVANFQHKDGELVLTDYSTGYRAIYVTYYDGFLMSKIAYRKAHPKSHLEEIARVAFLELNTKVAKFDKATKNLDVINTGGKVTIGYKRTDARQHNKYLEACELAEQE